MIPRNQFRQAVLVLRAGTITKFLLGPHGLFKNSCTGFQLLHTNFHDTFSSTSPPFCCILHMFELTFCIFSFVAYVGYISTAEEEVSTDLRLPEDVEVLRSETTKKGLEKNLG